MRTPEHTRTKLLDAALDAMRKAGYNGFTLDLVAKTAGVSKGGLLHHFPSKDALIEAILRQLFVRFEALVQQYYDQDKDDSGRWLRAYVRATFDDDPPPIEIATILLSAFIENHALMQFLQEDFAGWRSRLLRDGLPAARARVIWQAADAYWLDRILGSDSMDEGERQALIDELIGLTRMGAK